MRRWKLVLVCAAGCLAAAGLSRGGAAPGVARAEAAPDDAPPGGAAATKPFTSAKGDFVLRFPSAWAVQEVAADPGSDLKLSIRLDAGGPAVTAWGYLGAVPNERAHIRYQLPYHLRNYEAASHEVGSDPVPFLWTETPYVTGNVRHLLALTHRRRCCMRFVFEFPAALWDRLGAAALEVVRTADTKCEDWPARPPGYRPLVKDGYQYLLPAAVKDRDVAAFHAYVLETEKAYEKSHGAVPKPDSNPIEILLHDTREDADALTTQRGHTPWSRFGVFDESGSGSLIAARTAAASADARPDLAYSLTRVFHDQSFGPYLPWMREMEAFAAWAEAAAGRPLPAVPQSIQDSLRAKLVRFDELTRAEPAAVVAARGSLLKYLLLFRTGPKTYRDAWAAFLAELQASGDFAQAEKILLALDQDKLVADAASLAERAMKPAKGR